MGKAGPCCHCGVASTPLWRNGPPDKPVLCNACGSRWRTKGTLTNYTPLHARETFDVDEVRTSKVKILAFKNKEQKLEKAKQGSNPLQLEHEIQYCDQNFRKFAKGDVNNRSSSGSAISNSESCAIVGTINANDMAGSSQSNIWESSVPSKKRTFLTRPKASPVEKLTKDLFSILHEQQSSNLSGLSEEDLIYENGTPFGSNEIGYGSLLIRHSNPVFVEEESEASSFPSDKSDIINGSYSGLTSSPVNIEIKGSDSATDKLKYSSARSAKENVRRDKTSPEKLKLLLDRDSSLGSTDLNDLVNFEGFMRYLTYEEQQTLMKYLPSIDTVRLPQSLRTMFQSSQFIETFSFFQQLLQEGIFDLTFSGVNVENCRTLKRLVLLDLERYKWVENYKKLKVRVGKGKEMGPNVNGIYSLTSAKRAHDYWDLDSSDTDGGPKRSLKRVCKLGVSNSPSCSSPQLKSSETASKLSVEKGGVTEVEGGGSFTRMSLLPSMSDMCCMLAPSQFTDDSSDQDLLLNVPPCNASYPEAELLCHAWKENSNPISSPAERTVSAKKEETFSSFQSLILASEQLTNHR